MTYFFLNFMRLAAEIHKSLRRLGVPSLRFRYFSSVSSMDWSTSVITPLSSDTEPCIVITFLNAKYIFNAGENSIRSAIQTSRNWRRSRALFLTQAKIDKISGLGGEYSSRSCRVIYKYINIGLIMNIGDAGITNELDIFGPPGTAHILASMRSFVYRYVFHSN